MKLLSKYLTLAIAFFQVSLVTPLSRAENNHECFILNEDGQPIDLGYLCGNSRPNANTSTLKTNTYNISHNSDTIVIPIKKRVGGTPVIEVKFNNKYIFEMLFDTGATMTVITEAMATTLKVDAIGSLPFQTASNDLIFFDVGRVNSASVDGMTNDNMNIAIAPTLEMGLLGQDFYGMYDITIKSNTIELRKR